MEPFKALTLLVAAAIVSLVGAGAAGFYAGYSAGRGNLEEIKAQIASAQQPVIQTGEGGAVSLKPVMDDIRALSKQVEGLASVKARAASDSDHGDAGLKPVLDEIKALSSRIDGLKADSLKPQPAPAAAIERPAAPDYSDTLRDIRDQVHTLGVKFDKQEPKAPKAVLDEIHALAASIQAQEPAQRRAVADEIRSAVATLQTAEPKVAKALMDEVRAISANVRASDSRPQQVSVLDQLKVLQASVEALKAKLSEQDRGRDVTVGAEVAQLRQLVAAASDQFGKCQMQLASIGGAASSQPAMSPIAVTQSPRPEPSAVVFYDNVMLKKDQEKAYDEIGVHLALQSVGARQVRVAVNRQPFGLSFGERKVFRSQDVECEINLMETNLNDAQARVNISCKR
jgi:hypothetical protein